MDINCGIFLYSEFPNYFSLTLGVTGTLEQLSNCESDIIKNDLMFKNFTISPSVYGHSNLAPEKKPLICNIGNFFGEIINDIKFGLGPDSKRAVVVFFKNDKLLSDFYKHPKFIDF